MANQDNNRRSTWKDTFYHSNDGQEIFPVRQYPTLGSLDSYILHSRHQGSESTDQPSIDNAGRNHGGMKHVDVIRNSYDNPSDTVSQHYRLNKRKGKGVTTATGYDVHSQYYAGIAHSDLDIQTGRPPLMFHMNFVEWLWYKSDTQHRIIFMAVAVLFCVSFVQFFSGLYMVFSSEQYHNPYLCHTERCNYLSHRLRETMNTSVNPCHDFYAFVCGTSDITHDLTKEEDENWNYGFDVGRVIYDFRYSPTLGRLLSKMENKPATLILDMYHTCLDHRRRNKLGLEPYFQMLNNFKLYNISSSSPLTTDHVINSMAKILSHSFLTSAILTVKFYRDGETSDGPIRAYIEPAITEPIRTEAVFRYGYKTYYETVRSAFSMMKNELGITDEELDILPHDIICFELFFRDEYTTEKMQYIVDDDDNAGHKPCEFGDNFNGTNIKTNFGNAPNSDFDFELLIRIMYKESNPEWDQNNPKTPFGDDFVDPINDIRTHTDFVERFSKEFRRSAPIRFVRYLQWRLFYRMAYELDETSIHLIKHVTRHRYIGNIANCFHCLFHWLPFLAPHSFLENSETEINGLIDEFDQTANQTSNIYNHRATKGIVNNMESVLGIRFTDRDKKIIAKILITDVRVDSIPPVEFNDRSFVKFRELYTNIAFTRDFHLQNIFQMGYRMHAWQTSPKFRNIYYGIPSQYRVWLKFDRSTTIYDRVTKRYRIYLPMALADSPFSNDGLQISDLGGLGLEFAGNLETAFLSSLVYSLSQDYLHNQFNTSEFQDKQVEIEDIDRIERHILDYHGKIREEFRSQIAEYTVGHKRWGQFRYRSSSDQVLTTALHDQSRYQAISVVANDFLHRKDTHWKERKSVLAGLKHFNLMQIFYISLVNRRCEKMGPKKLEHISQFGPLPQAISSNLALSNLDDFSKTFNCPLGSPMNRKKKVYFWDRNFNVKTR